MFNWLAARSMGGTFILRIEDTDPERSRAEHERAIFDALLYIGLDWDEGPDVGGNHGPYKQSARDSFYRNAVENMLGTGDAYPCFCTEDELEAKRRAVIASGKPYRYDRSCLIDCDAARKRMESGEPCSIRFRMPDEDIIVEDLIRGNTVFGYVEHSDPVIRRTDGSYTYNFTCAVDDSAMEISHVVRGEDHLSNTPKQMAMIRAMGDVPPEYAHVPLIHSMEGGKLKKRDYGEGINWFWEHGYLNEALFNYLALLGWSHPEGIEFLSKDEITKVFSIDRISKSPSKFDIAKLSWLNEQHMRALDADALYVRAQEFVSHGALESLRAAMGEENLKRALYELRDGYANLIEIPDKFAIFIEEKYQNELKENIGILMENREKNIELLTSLAAVAGSIDAVDEGDEAMHLMKSAGGKAGCKGKELFHPVRVALTGRAEGFELKRVLPILGKRRILERVGSALSHLQ